MSWKSIVGVVRRLKFVKLALQGQQSLAQLCRRFGISRKCGYKWKRRFEAEGLRGLRDRGRRPRHSPRQTQTVWLGRIRRLRRRHRTWGARKLRARLRKDFPRARVPAARTMGRWLRKWKLVRRPRPRTPRGPQRLRPALTVARRSNQVWTVDFKGWFYTRDGRRNEPLTVRDLFSRYLLGVRVLAGHDWEPVQRIFRRLFRKNGYPAVIRTDNGGPFGSTGPAGLTRLSAWWTALGIRVEFIAPGHPEQNGGHEQMHRVLKAETTQPSAQSRGAQQRRMDRWVWRYNAVRPHEGLGQRVPQEVYRPQPGRERRVEQRYPRGWGVRRVRSNGQIKWQGRKRSVGEALVGYRVGLKPLRGAKWEVYFGRVLIGELRADDPGGMRPVQQVRTRPVKRAARVAGAR